MENTQIKYFIEKETISQQEGIGEKSEDSDDSHNVSVLSKNEYIINVDIVDKDDWEIIENPLEIKEMLYYRITYSNLKR